MIAAIYADHFSYHYHLSLGTVVVHMLAEHRLKIYKQSQRRFSWKWKKKMKIQFQFVKNRPRSNWQPAAHVLVSRECVQRRSDTARKRQPTVCANVLFSFI